MKRIIALAMVLVLAFTLVACGGGKGSGSAYTDGVHEATVEGHNGIMTVVVTVESGKITTIDLKDHTETEGIYQIAAEAVIPAIIENNGTEGVDAAAGATITSDAIIKGTNEALAAK